MSITGASNAADTVFDEIQQNEYASANVSIEDSIEYYETIIELCTDVVNILKCRGTYK